MTYEDFKKKMLESVSDTKKFRDSIMFDVFLVYKFHFELAYFRVHKNSNVSELRMEAHAFADFLRQLLKKELTSTASYKK